MYDLFNGIIICLRLENHKFDLFNWIKIRFSGTPESQLWVKLGQSLLKLTKISNKLKFDVKSWKMMFWGGFDKLWLLVNPRLTKGTLVNLT